MRRNWSSRRTPRRGTCSTRGTPGGRRWRRETATRSAACSGDGDVSVSCRCRSFLLAKKNNCFSSSNTALKPRQRPSLPGASTSLRATMAPVWCLATVVITRGVARVSPGSDRRRRPGACVWSQPKRHGKNRSEVNRCSAQTSTRSETPTPKTRRCEPWSVPTSIPVAVVTCAAAAVLALVWTTLPSMAFADDSDTMSYTHESSIVEDSSLTKSADDQSTKTQSPLACASDPTCVSTRNELISAGVLGVQVTPANETKNRKEEEDPDAALRTAICPRNPTADVCRSRKDRDKVNGSPCKVPLLNACLVWREGASRELVLKR